MAYQAVINSLESVSAAGKKYVTDSLQEIKTECIPHHNFRSPGTWKSMALYLQSIFHIPYFPAFSRPGWMSSLLYSPRDEKYVEGLYGDLFAGFTVGMTIIPQALSYASLGGLPPINGLYAVILPSIVYIFMGSGMQLSVGPVALVSLLMGELLTKNGLSINTDPLAVVNYAAEACFCSGLLMLLMGLFNLGNLIRFISYPVMAGFTTASAMIIGLNQIKNAFGFASSAGVPQVGAAVDYNYEVMKWYMENWYGRDSDGFLWRNVHATNITFGIYVPLIALWLFKTNYKFSNETKKTLAYQIFNFIASMTTLLCLIIAGHEAYKIHSFNHTHHAQALKLVGEVPAGLSIFRTPAFEYDLGSVFVDVIPLTIISYMEGYAVARKTSAARGQLSILNASQELVALGAGNLLNCVASGYPVSGSFSRSSLYANCGAVSPLAMVVTLIIVLVALGTLTDAFYYIPQAALAAIVMVAVASLIDFHEFWVAWKLSKKDFFVMFATFIFTFVFDTEIGLGVGVGLSIVMLLKDLAYSLEAKPISRALAFNGVDVIRLNSNLVFVSATTIKDTLIDEIFEKKHGELQAVVIDFVDVKHADLSGLIAMKEVMDHAKKQQITVVLVNISTEMQVHLTKAHIEGDDITKCSEDLQDKILAAQAVSGDATVETLDVESLGMVTELLKESKTNTLIALAQWSANRRPSDAVALGGVGNETIKISNTINSNISNKSNDRDLEEEGVELISPGMQYSVVRRESEHMD